MQGMGSEQACHAPFHPTHPPSSTPPFPCAPQVRNLVANAGLDVRVLRRVRIGGYRLPRDLGFGAFRELRPHEVRRVINAGADRVV